MGLDINVYRPVITDAGIDDELFYVADLAEHPELEVFSDFICVREEKHYDLDSAIQALGKDPKDSECLGVFHGEDSVTFEFQEKDGKVFEIKDPAIVIKPVRVIFCADEGYQRKGANRKFYEDGIWDSLVLTKETLLEHWERYFSYETPDSVGGWGSGVERSGLSDEERKADFKRNIIDNFIEGETFVLYH